MFIYIGKKMILLRKSCILLFLIRVMKISATDHHFWHIYDIQQGTYLNQSHSSRLLYDHCPILQMVYYCRRNKI